MLNPNTNKNVELSSLGYKSKSSTTSTDTESTRDKSNKASKPPRRSTRGNLQGYAVLNDPQKTTRSTYYIEKHPTKIRRGFAMRVVKANIQPIPNVPTNVDEALNRPNGSEQRKAFEEELNSYEVQKTQDLVKLLRSRKALLGRQVIVIKLNVNGLIARFKARWVVKGFRQIEGVNYDETFSLVVKSITQRILLALGAKYNLFIEHVDIVTAFLELLLREEVYIKQPYGFVKNPNLVYQLLKALYSLK